MLGHCGDAGAFGEEVPLICVFAREHQCWHCPTTCSSCPGLCSGGLPSGSCSGLQPLWAPSFLASASHPMLCVSYRPSASQDCSPCPLEGKNKCHHLNCPRFLASLTLEETAFVHFWDYTKFVSESMSTNVDTVDGMGGIFQILWYSSHCYLLSLFPWTSPAGNCMELQKANSTLNVTNENATSPVIEFWE